MKSFFLMLFACVLLQVNAQESAKSKQPKTITDSIKVAGVCGMCKATIEKAAYVPGVKFASWNKNTGMLKLVYKPAKTDMVKIATSISNVGYQTSIDAIPVKNYDKLPECCKYHGNEKH